MRKQEILKILAKNGQKSPKSIQKFNILFFYTKIQSFFYIIPNKILFWKMLTIREKMILRKWVEIYIVPLIQLFFKL